MTIMNIPEPQDLTGTTIGPYEITERLGEGGMGVVYLAAQSAPLRRKVAIKVIKLGMDTREVITRFKSERQALALMDHPNIAKVLDAGVTDTGRPYFVMEYIQGVSLTRYCRDHGLGLRRRLDLFIQVCRGVQHAHQKGVIHRDLKPGNILVTEVEGKPVPKIIDFGVAKATGQHLAARTFFTQLGRVIGTPEYMSPEQADLGHQDIDTRSDVFSLGVVLYELLTGVLPIGRDELLRAGYDSIATLVREAVPPRPSTRLTSSSTGPKQRRRDTTVEPRTWGKRVRGDLDWITMKALEKERERRYATVTDLVNDLERHRNDQVVLAGPPSRTYRVRKFVQRNRTGVGIAVALVIALISFGVWQAVQSRIIAHQRNEAMASHRLALAESHLATDPTVAVAFALASLEISDQLRTRAVVRQAYTRGPLRIELPRWDGRGNPLCCAASPDGRFCASSWSHT
ncbi:protein kinase, partial [bacterium]|nr:protein kinase [bacterium]